MFTWKEGSSASLPLPPATAGPLVQAVCGIPDLCIQGDDGVGSQLGYALAMKVRHESDPRLEELTLFAVVLLRDGRFGVVASQVEGCPKNPAHIGKIIAGAAVFTGKRLADVLRTQEAAMALSFEGHELTPLWRARGPRKLSWSLQALPPLGLCWDLSSLMSACHKVARLNPETLRRTEPGGETSSFEEYAAMDEAATGTGERLLWDEAPRNPHASSVYEGTDEERLAAILERGHPPIPYEGPEDDSDQEEGIIEEGAHLQRPATA